MGPIESKEESAWPRELWELPPSGQQKPPGHSPTITALASYQTRPHKGVLSIPRLVIATPGGLHIYCGETGSLLTCLEGKGKGPVATYEMPGDGYPRIASGDEAGCVRVWEGEAPFRRVHSHQQRSVATPLSSNG
jgi:hypothetical protein